MRPRRKVECVIAAVCVTCLCYLLLHADIQDCKMKQVFRNTWQYNPTKAGNEQPPPEPAFAVADVPAKQQDDITRDGATQPTLPDRVVVMARLPEDNTSWVQTDLQGWQSAIYHIDTQASHETSFHNPLTNGTTRMLRNKGMEANAYLAYVVQNYNNLPSTVAFIHPHKDGYPLAWHTDNAEHSNLVSLRTLNTDFIQRNGYANLRCIHDPGCPHEVMPFRDPPEDHRTIEAAMPSAWQDLFGNTDVPHILATPCCAQFAVSSKQVRMRPLEDYQEYYKWLMDTTLKDETSGRVFEYLWHVIFGQDPVYCPALKKCYCDVYSKC